MTTQPIPPDGGWGWMVVLGASLCHMMIGIVVRSIGVYYLQFKDKYDATATTTSWLLAVSLGFWNGFGPVTTALCNRFGCRIVTIVGGLFMTVGLVVTGLSNSIVLTYFSFGLLMGVGLSFIYIAGYILVGKYFDKRKSIAFALASFGSSVGTFGGAPFVDFLFNFYGFFGAFLIVGGIALNAVLAGALYRPISFHHALTKLKDKEKNVDSIESEEEHVETSKLANERKKQKMFNFSLLKSWIFAVVLIMYFTLSMTLSATITFLPAMALDHGIGEQKAVLLLSVLGIADCVCRLPLGCILDLSRLRPTRGYLYVSLAQIQGLSVLLMPACAFNYWLICAACCLNGISSSAMMPQRLIFLGDLFGVEKAPSGLGLIMLNMSLGSIIARLIGGLFKDYMNTFDPLFYLGGGLVVITTTIMMIVMKIDESSKSKALEAGVSVDGEDSHLKDANSPALDGSEPTKSHLSSLAVVMSSTHSLDISAT